jgi:hypothetical protein
MITPRTPRTVRIKSSLLLAAALSALAVNAPAQTLLSRFTLDNTPTSTGTVAVTGTLTGSAAFSASGAGVGVFDKALSTSDGTNDFLSAPTGGNAAFGLSAMTIALWVNIDAAANDDRLVSNLTTTTGFDLSIKGYSAGTGAGGADGFSLAFGFNSTSGAVQSADAKYVSDKWLFLAVTYDSATSTVSFYSGDELSALTLNDTAVKSGSIGASLSNLEIGGTPVTSNDRSPTALFNDVRIYNGALSLSDLEAVRASAVIPEPSHMALFFGMILTGYIAIKRRVRR